MAKNGRIDPKFWPMMYLWGFYQFSKFRKKMTFLKKKSPTYPLHIPYKIPQKWTKMPRKWLKMVQLSPNFDTWCIWGVFINFQNFGKKGQKIDFFPKKTPKISKNAKIPYKWQPSGTSEANIAYTLKFIAPHPQTKFWENPPIFLLFRAILRKSKKTQKSPTSGNQVAVGHKI